MSVTVSRNVESLFRLKFSDRRLIREILLLLRERIIRRTLSGRDEDEAGFAPYSPRYKKAGQRVTLQDTGEMLQGITPVSVGTKQGDLGFKGGGSLRKATYHQVTGAGRSQVIRRFFGVSSSDEDEALKKVEEFIVRQFS